MPTLRDQLEAAQGARSIREGVAAMNSLVTDECQVKPRSAWRLGLRPPLHRLQDITSVLNTSTYTTLDRCRDCGLCVLGSGL